MKVEELMIGDWVMYDEFIDKSMNHPIKITHLDKDSVLTRHYYPIPLTTEILEKNGFEKELTEDGIHYHFTLISDNIKFSLLYVRNVFQWLGPLDFKYVHELQHALRLCGIKKEIIL